MTRLDKELEYFNKNKEEYLKYFKGKYALIKGEEFINTFTAEEEAYNEGIDRFGNTPFLIKLITDKEFIHMLPALTLGLIHAHT
ncbi:MAG: hypothetical protein HQL03_05830 [Nitrospirae bacterium]|nr:hypothetical protein [Nitrospirota bacterium]MBF0591582.1 hypothetical protein [Nitrospirota bacterium]